MSELQVFSNAEFGSVRSITVNGEPYFVGKDVAEILGYANTRNALAKHVDEEDRMDGVAIRDSIGREQTPALINESGLYSLILSSRLPSAKRFKRWVTSEVLPAIRKHGVFAMDDIDLYTMNSERRYTAARDRGTDFPLIWYRYPSQT